MDSLLGLPAVTMVALVTFFCLKFNLSKIQ